jgi:hypothetical protein
MLTCQWFALCDNEAYLAARGPVGGGAWDWLPVCDRCAGRLKLETVPVIIEIEETE